MGDLKVQDIEEFIKNVEVGIKQIDKAIKYLEGYDGRNASEYALPINILQQEKQLGEEELKNFREKGLSEVIGGGINMDRLTEYRNIIISEE